MTCKRCTEPMTGRKRKYCTGRCREAAKSLRRYYGRKHPEQTCRGCGETYHPKQATRTSYCSRECAFQHRYPPPPPPPASVRSLVYFPSCEICDVVFTSRLKREAPTCSRRCSNERARRLSFDKESRQYKPKEFQCAECGVLRLPRCGDKNRRFCSEFCCKRNTHRALKQRRRAIERGVHAERIESLEIFDRDRWVCGICLCSVPKDVHVQHPHAATLDHIIPLSKGGTHTHDNVQLAHRQCNTLKSDTLPGGGQNYNSLTPMTAPPLSDRFRRLTLGGLADVAPCAPLAAVRWLGLGYTERPTRPNVAAISGWCRQ